MSDILFILVIILCIIVVVITTIILISNSFYEFMVDAKLIDLNYGINKTIFLLFTFSLFIKGNIYKEVLNNIKKGGNLNGDNKKSC